LELPPFLFSPSCFSSDLISVLLIDLFSSLPVCSFSILCSLIGWVCFSSTSTFFSSFAFKFPEACALFEDPPNSGVVGDIIFSSTIVSDFLSVRFSSVEVLFTALFSSFVM
jgi:hypothetical protein